MSVLNYCLDIQMKLKNMKPTTSGPANQDPHFMDWFGDTGKASGAVSAALEANDSKALRIAEPLAEKWHI